MRAAALALALLAVAGLAAGHGASSEAVKEVGPYKVTYFGYDYTTEGELIRAAWRVERAASGERVPMAEAVLNVTVLDARGAVVAAYDKDLIETGSGFVYADLVTGARGVLRFRVPLPQGNATFDQAVCNVDAQGQLACGVAQARGSPGAGAGLAALALALAALRGIPRTPPRR